MEGTIALILGVVVVLMARYAAEQDEMGWAMMLSFFGFITMVIGVASFFVRW